MSGLASLFRAGAVAGALAVVAAACSSSPSASSGAPARAAVGAGSTSAPAATSPSTTPPAPLAAPASGFVFEAQPLPPATRDRMTGPVWRPGCPVSLDELRTVRLTFWGLDGVEHEGALVVHSDAVPTLRGVFAELHAARWPIRQIRPVEDFGGDDNASMDADNTSAFNCRASTGSSSTWSQHAYGRAVDINPRENPYVTASGVEPQAGRSFLDRSASDPGLIGATSLVVTAFDRRGWGWGGRWSGTKDYQHFSATGR